METGDTLPQTSCGKTNSTKTPVNGAFCLPFQGRGSFHEIASHHGIVLQSLGDLLGKHKALKHRRPVHVGFPL